MAKNGTVTVLDIGSSKVVCLIADIDVHGSISVRGIGHQLSQGIRAGIVIDVKKAETSILAAVNAAEKMAGETIEEAFITISGGSVGSHLITVESSIQGYEVTDRDIAAILAQGKAQFEKDHTEIIHRIPTQYSIDDTHGIRDPRGMFGNRLRTDLHVITASSTAVRNLVNCLARCHLNVEGVVSAPYAAGLACLMEDEMNLGVTLLDIGAGTTSITIFARGGPMYVDSIAVGGQHITRDIAKGLSTSMAFAERIKTLYGTVISTPADEREIIAVPQTVLEPDADNGEEADMEEIQISRAYLTSIIKPRIEEILEMAKKRMDQSAFLPLSGSRIVLTGGSSQLEGVKELTSHFFQKHCRLGRPHTFPGMADMTRGPAFSVAVGMLIHAQNIRQDHPRKAGIGTGKGKVPLKGMFKWLQENF